MIRESCVERPTNDRFIPIREWQIQFCEDKFASDDGKKKPLIAGAALMSFFEHWHNVKLQMNEKSSRMNDVSETHGDSRAQDESLLQFHTSQDIEDALLGLAAEDQIRRARRFLVECGVITEHSNPNPRYKFDKTIYYQFHPEVLNDYIRNDYPKNRVSYPKNRDGEPKNREPYKENTAEEVLLEKEPKNDQPQSTSTKAKEKAKKNGAVSFTPAREDFAGFANPDIAMEIWAGWMSFKKAQFGKTYKTESSERVAIAQLLAYSGGSIPKARAIVNRSIAGPWMGLQPYDEKSAAAFAGLTTPTDQKIPEDTYQLSEEMQKRYESSSKKFYEECHLCAGIRWLSKKEYEKVVNKDSDFIGAMWYTKIPNNTFNTVVWDSLSELNKLPRWEKEKWKSVYEWLKKDVSDRVFGRK